MSAATPLVDFFRRGDVQRDVRLLAASGALAPAAHEQLAILILLVDDQDVEIRTTALRTIDSIPVEALRAFLARSDVAIGIREFFGDRGVFPAEIPALSAAAPLIDVEPDVSAVGQPASDEDDQTETKEGIVERLSTMSVPEKVKAAVKGSREVRAILIRDPNKMIALSVLSSPKLTDSEVEGFARMANVSEEILRTIGSNRAWLKNYGVVTGLTKNAKTPLGLSLNLIGRLNDRDLKVLATDRNVPEALRAAARRKVASGPNAGG